MTKALNRIVEQLPPSGIRRFFDIANEMEGVISLGVGEPDFLTPWNVRYEAIYQLRHGRTYYTANAGFLRLREAITAYLKRKYALHYQADNEILVTIGGSEAIDVACRTLLNSGDEVICMDPSYVSYVPLITLAGGVAVPLQLKAEHAFVMQPEDLEAKITPKTKAVILNYPNNPTGAGCTREELEVLAAVIKKHDLYLITDEIYAELWYGTEEYVSIAALAEMKERTIYINGFAKAFAMTGWRLGYACGPEHIISQMLKIHQYTIMAAPTLSQHAAITALNEGDESVEEMRQAYDERRRFLLARFKAMGLPCFSPKGAFYVFPDIRSFGLSSEAFAIELLKEERVAVVPGSAFGESGEGFLRLSYAYSIEELAVAIEKIERFIQKKRVEMAKSN